jgi:hypothetical protein
MSATPMMSIAGAVAAINAVTALFTGGAGTLVLRSGSLEATTLTSDAGSAVATLTLSSTAFITPATHATSNGLATATANAVTSDTNAAGGAAAHFRMKTNGGVVIFQGTVGTSAADLIINTTTITAGDTVACTSFLVTLPCGDGVS